MYYLGSQGILTIEDFEIRLHKDQEERIRL